MHYMQRRDTIRVAVTRWEENSRGIIIVEVIAQTLTQATREALAEATARGYGECVVLPWRHTRTPVDDEQAFSFSFPIRQKKERRGFTFR
jgi:hypothetical protein